MQEASTWKSLVLLCFGLPGSGKSTLSQRLLDFLPTSHQILEAQSLELVVVDPDEIEQSLRGHCAELANQFDPKTWKEARVLAEQVLEYLLQQSQQGLFEPVLDRKGGSDSLSWLIRIASRLVPVKYRRSDLIHKSDTVTQGLRIFLIEDTFIYSSMRKRIRNLSILYSCAYGQIYLSCVSLDYLLAVNVKRAQSGHPVVPKDVLVSQFSKMEGPNADMNRWERHSLCWDIFDQNNSQNLVASALEFIQKVLHAFCEEEASRFLAEQQPLCDNLAALSYSSGNHDLYDTDIYLRRAVSSELHERSLNVDSKKVLAKSLAQAKKHLLSSGVALEIVKASRSACGTEEGIMLALREALYSRISENHSP